MEQLLGPENHPGEEPDRQLERRGRHDRRAVTRRGRIDRRRGRWRRKRSHRRFVDVGVGVGQEQRFDARRRSLQRRKRSAKSVSESTEALETEHRRILSFELIFG